ncbi:MAG: DUF4383 domain-containing protein [Micromonosporaceae bacterium]
MHLPVNHPLRRFYRILAGGVGVYVLVFGIAGFLRTQGMDTFAVKGERVFGLTANPAFALLSVVAGVLLLAGLMIGRNIDHFLNLIAGSIFLVSGMAMLALLRTDLNVLAFTMTNCVVSFVFGTVVLSAGLYGKSGARDAEAAEEQHRHGVTR